jgi:hypothetical protein
MTNPDTPSPTTTARVVHVKENVEGAVYVGRALTALGLSGSPFGNPFRIGEHGDRAACIRLYREWLLGSPALLARLPELRNKPLACWCRRDGRAWSPATACHGDVLIELLDRYTDDELRAMRKDDA